MSYRIHLIALLAFTLCVHASAQPAATPASARYADIDKTALAIPESQTGSTREIADYMAAHFKTDSDKTRAIFIWVAANISFDIRHQYTTILYDNNIATSNRDREREEKINSALEKRKGVCLHFAVVFNDICLKSGLRSYVIDGYVKQNEETDEIEEIPHAWCATRIDSSWYMFDPTWGSGYRYQGRWVKDIRDSFYKVPPARFIASHMPYDPMWQFLGHLVSNQEFKDGHTADNASKPLFSYEDTIADYERLDSVAQCRAALQRIVANGIKHGPVQEEIDVLRQTAEAYKYNTGTTIFNDAITDYNDAVEGYNKAANYLNSLPEGATPEPGTLATIDKAYAKLNRAKTTLGSIKGPDKDLAHMIAEANKAINELLVHVQKQKDALEKK